MTCVILDLDNTTLQYNRALANAVIGWHKPAPPKRCKSYNLVESEWFNTKDEFVAAHTRAVTEGMFATMPAYPHASETLHQLRAAGYTIKIATHRYFGDVPHDLVERTTLEGLARNGIPFDEIHFVQNKEEVQGDIYLDDAPYVLTALTQAGLPYLAKSHEYNRQFPGPRFNDWRHVPSLLSQLTDLAA